MGFPESLTQGFRPEGGDHLQSFRFDLGYRSGYGLTPTSKAVQNLRLRERGSDSFRLKDRNSLLPLSELKGRPARFGYSNHHGTIPGV
jgi:hypothetical protein